MLLWTHGCRKLLGIMTWFPLDKYPKVELMDHMVVVVLFTKSWPTLCNPKNCKLGEGNGTPLQYSCLENPMDGGALVGCSPWGREESDMTEWLHFHFSLSCIEEGNGNPLQYSYPENPRDRGAWGAASLWGRRESDTTEVTWQQQQRLIIKRRS